MFKAGHFIASSNVNISDNNMLEYAGVFNLTLSISDELMTMGLVLGEKATALATIYDNDGRSSYILTHYLLYAHVICMHTLF